MVEPERANSWVRKLISWSVINNRVQNLFGLALAESGVNTLAIFWGDCQVRHGGQSASWLLLLLLTGMKAELEELGFHCNS
jgi:hypothetical protein